MISVQEFYVLRGQIQIAQIQIVAFVGLQRKTLSLEVKANLVMPAKRRLFNQDFLKCALSVLLPSTKVIFYNCFILIFLDCTLSRTDCSSKRQRIENHIALLSATDHPTFEQVLISSIRRVSSGYNKELQLKTLGKPTSITLMYKIKQRGFYPSN